MPFLLIGAVIAIILLLGRTIREIYKSDDIGTGKEDNEDDKKI